MRNPLARFLAPKKEPKPKGYYASANEIKREFFNDRKKNLAKYETIYKQGGMVTEAINTYPLYILTNGYRFEGEDEMLVQKVQDKCEEIDLDACIYQGVVDALVFGDGYQEIAPSAVEDVGAIFPRPAKTFETVYDEYGVIMGFKQTVGQSFESKLTIDFAPTDIIHVVMHQVGGSPTGISLIERCYDEIMRDAKIAEASSAAVERHGFPKYHIKVGKEDEDIPREDMLSIANQFQDLKAKNEFVTNHDIEILSLDTASMNINEYGNWAIQRLCSALGVPEEMLGLGRGSTEATANVRLQSFYDKIGTYQKRIARIYNLQLIDKITGKPGAVKLVFNDVSPVDEELKSRWISQIMASTPGDPFAILPQEWVRDQFDIEASEYETEEEPLDESLMEEGAETAPPVEGEEGAEAEVGEEGAGDMFETPSTEERGLVSHILDLAREMDAHSAACKAVIARGDKPGPACGGSEEPSKSRPKGKGEEETKERPAPKGEPEKKGVAKFDEFKRGEFKLNKEGQAAMKFVVENRKHIGHNKWNHALGKAGETVIHELANQLNAHRIWPDAQDLSNTELFDVKTMNPKSESTPVMSNALRRKQELAKKSGKEWAFPLLVASEDGKRADVYIHTVGEDFYKKDVMKGEHYDVTKKGARYMGYFDTGTFTFHPAKEGAEA